MNSLTALTTTADTEQSPAAPERPPFELTTSECLAELRQAFAGWIAVYLTAHKPGCPANHGPDAELGDGLYAAADCVGSGPVGRNLRYAAEQIDAAQATTKGDTTRAADIARTLHQAAVAYVRQAHSFTQS